MTQQKTVYDPSSQYEVKAFDVECRQSEDGSRLVRIYQPQGDGPYPVLLDVHGGAWSGGDRLMGKLRDTAFASSGLLVVATELRTSPEHTYPAQVQDANYAIRWAKANASQYNGDPNRVGAFGISSGGHTLMLSVMRPIDEQFSSIPLVSDPNVDATVSYVILESPVLDPYARYQYAKEAGRQGLIEGSENYFGSEDVMKQGNPQMILDRGEKAKLPPALLIQGTNDANVPLSIPKRFVQSYRAAGGQIDIEFFENAEHGFSRTPSTDTDRAIGLVKDFIASNVNS